MILGLAAGMLIWAVDAYMYRNVTDIFWDLMAFGGFGLAFGFVFNSLLHLRAWAAVTLTAVAIYLPIFASYNNLCTLADWCPESPPFSVGPVAGAGLLIGCSAASFCGFRRKSALENPNAAPGAHRMDPGGGVGRLWALSCRPFRSRKPQPH